MGWSVITKWMHSGNHQNMKKYDSWVLYCNFSCFPCMDSFIELVWCDSQTIQFTQFKVNRWLLFIFTELCNQRHPVLFINIPLFGAICHVWYWNNFWCFQHNGSKDSDFISHSRLYFTKDCLCDLLLRQKLTWLTVSYSLLHDFLFGKILGFKMILGVFSIII